jgi:hypothetical protein
VMGVCDLEVLMACQNQGSLAGTDNCNGHIVGSTVI